MQLLGSHVVVTRHDYRLGASFGEASNTLDDIDVAGAHSNATFEVAATTGDVDAFVSEATGQEPVVLAYAFMVEVVHNVVNAESDDDGLSC